MGDKNTSGGEAISGCPTDSVLGKAIVRIDDLVYCPGMYPDGTPHGINPVVEGCPTTTIKGKAAALDGHRSACGCQLISSRHTAAQESTVSRNYGRFGSGATSSITTWAQTSERPAGLQVLIRNSDTGETLKNRSYIANINGIKYIGTTDDNGYAKVEAKEGDIIDLHVLFESPNIQLNPR